MKCIHFLTTLGILDLWICAATVGRQIRAYAALGDSYAAGDGAGSSKLLPGFDATCGRFSKAYPVEVAETLDLGHKWFSFRNVACGGATTRSVIWDQLRSVWHADLVTIQVGGNEVDFFPVLNECIQQWHPFSTCDRELDRARGITQSTEFVEAYDRMVNLASRVQRQDAVLLILGYARFFNDETEQCNNATFSLTNPVNILSNKLRRTFNELVLLLNDVIRASAEAHGAVYVDVDAVFEGHRFCEEGVIEPHPDWEGTWFFREKPERGSEDVDGSLSHELRALGNMHAISSNPFKRFADLTRTFHPTARGHQEIAKEILKVTSQREADMMIQNI